MRFRISYSVFRGNSLENEDYVDDEVRFLRHQSIEVGDRDHDREQDRGWFVVPSLEQVVWLQRHYAKTSRYVSIGAVALIVEPEDLDTEVSAVGALLRRVRFVSEALELEKGGSVILRYVDADEALAADIAALTAYATRITVGLLPASAGSDWGAASSSYREVLVGRGPADDEPGALLIGPADLPRDAAGLRRLIESLRPKPRRRVNLRHDPADHDLAREIAAWLAEATGASVLQELA